MRPDNLHNNGDGGFSRALTIYDMCKSVDREMAITEIYLESKKGGKSVVYQRGNS